MLCSGGCLCAETVEKPDSKRFSGMEKVHRNSIKITVDLWWTKAELVRTLRTALDVINRLAQRDANCVFIAREAEHDLHVVIVEIYRDQKRIE